MCVDSTISHVIGLNLNSQISRPRITSWMVVAIHIENTRLRNYIYNNLFNIHYSKARVIV